MQGAVAFTVPGLIGGKGRGRAFRRGNHVGVYTPEKTRSQEAIVRQQASLAMNDAQPLEGPLRLRVTLWKPIPASWSRKKREAAVYVTGKPDADNTIKLLGDAMNGICYRDDSQIAELFFIRRYGERAYIDISVEPLAEAA